VARTVSGLSETAFQQHCKSQGYKINRLFQTMLPANDLKCGYFADVF